MFWNFRFIRVRTLVIIFVHFVPKKYMDPDLYLAVITLGKNSAISGKRVKMAVVKSIRKKKGNAYLAICIIGSLVNPWITKRLNPTGGVIWLTCSKTI